MSEWFLTDDNNFQCCRQIDDCTFEFVEIEQYHSGAELYKLKRNVINVKDYEYLKVELLHFYGYEENADIDNQIVAECIFEIYCEVDDWNYPYESYAAAVRAIEYITKLNFNNLWKG